MAKALVVSGGGRYCGDGDSSWLNQVEIRLSRIERQVIAGSVFTSVADVSRKLMHFIRHCSKTARPFRRIL